MDPLAQVTKAALLNDCTLFCAWSPLVSPPETQGCDGAMDNCMILHSRLQKISITALANATQNLAPPTMSDG